MASEGGVEKEGMSEYVSHHLTHLKSRDQDSLVDFSVVHGDTVFFSLFCAALVLIFLRLAASRATAGVPLCCRATSALMPPLPACRANSSSPSNC